MPTQICTWMHDNLEDGRSDHHGQFLYALKNTRENDRQVVWEGGSDRGIIAVVDFAAPVVCVASIYYAWGATTMLPKPVNHDALRSVPVLADRFFGSGRFALAGRPKRLSSEIANAIDRLAGGLPPHQAPTGNPSNAPTHRWFGSINIDPESVFETAVLASPTLQRKIGFASSPSPQIHISPRNRPDLLGDGIVGEVKRRLVPKDVGQLERYLDELECSRRRTDAWRGVLIHAGELSPAVAARADTSARRTQIQIWKLERGRLRPFKAIRQWSAPRT